MLVSAERRHSLNLTIKCDRCAGTTGGWIDERDRELPFSQKEEPATIPRVSTLILITSLTPWCTIVRNDKGVTLGNICETLYKECVFTSFSDPLMLTLYYRYSENVITEAELASLPHRVQEMVKRTAIANAQAAQGWQSVYYQPQVPTSRLPRYSESLLRLDSFTKLTRQFLSRLAS